MKKVILTTVMLLGSVLAHADGVVKYEVYKDGQPCLCDAKVTASVAGKVIHTGNWSGAFSAPDSATVTFTVKKDGKTTSIKVITGQDKVGGKVKLNVQ